MPKTVQMSGVADILNSVGPCLSSHIIDWLEKRGVSRQTARKRIERAPSDVVCRLKHIRFPHNETFLYLRDHFRTDSYFRNLREALESTGSVYGCAINSIIARDGSILRKHFDIVSGGPVVRMKGHIGSSTILANLVKVGLLESVDRPGIGELLILGDEGASATSATAKVKARLLTEGVLIRCIADWLRKLGLVSYHKVAVRDEEPQVPRFAQFSWDLTAPSYVHPLVSHGDGRKPLPGFCVADIVMSNMELNQRHMEYFVRKCESVRSQKSQRPFLSMIVANRFNPAAFQLGKQKGLFLTTPTILLGEDMTKSLISLMETLQNAARVATTEPERIEALFEKFSKIAGADNNLRGAFFEMIVAHCVREEKGSWIEIGKDIIDPEDGSRANIDVFSRKGKQEVWFCECKGYSPATQVSLQEVKEWREKRIKRIRNWLKTQSEYVDAQVGFEFWTASRFSNDAETYLKASKEQTRKYHLDYRDGASLLAYARHLNLTTIVRFLNEHFIRNPLSQLVP